MNFSVVIPTYKRPDALWKTIESVLWNTRLPQELIVIDDDVISNGLIEEIQGVCDSKKVPFKYHKKDHSKVRRGLSESKNIATKLASHEVLFFLDDDVVLEAEYFSEIMKVWEGYREAPYLLGVGGRITNNRSTTRLEKLYRKVFGLGGKYAWDVNDVGFQVWDESVEATERGYYIHGGVSSYQREKLLQMPFATFSGGRTGLEDVEHCLRAKKLGYYFFYVPSARLAHYPQEKGREGAFLSGKKESKNRKEIFTTHSRQDMYHRVWFIWANIGWIVKKIAAFRFREAGGMLKGLWNKSC